MIKRTQTLMPATWTLLALFSVYEPVQAVENIGTSASTVSAKFGCCRITAIEWLEYTTGNVANRCHQQL